MELYTYLVSTKSNYQLNQIKYQENYKNLSS